MIFLEHVGCLTYCMPWGIQIRHRCEAKWKAYCVKWKTPPSCHADGSVIFLKTSGPETWLKVKVFLSILLKQDTLEGKKKGGAPSGTRG